MTEDRISAIRGKATISVEEARHVLGVGRNQMYQAVREGTVPSLRIGKRILIPVQPLLAMIGDRGAPKPDVEVIEPGPSEPPDETVLYTFSYGQGREDRLRRWRPGDPERCRAAKSSPLPCQHPRWTKLVDLSWSTLKRANVTMTRPTAYCDNHLAGAILAHEGINTLDFAGAIQTPARRTLLERHADEYRTLMLAEASRLRASAAEVFPPLCERSSASGTSIAEAVEAGGGDRVTFTRGQLSDPAFFQANKAEIMREFEAIEWDVRRRAECATRTRSSSRHTEPRPASDPQS